jgi:hypothetical protein
MSLLWLIAVICLTACVYAGYRLGRYIEHKRHHTS